MGEHLNKNFKDTMKSIASSSAPVYSKGSIYKLRQVQNITRSQLAMVQHHWPGPGLFALD